MQANQVAVAASTLVTSMKHVVYNIYLYVYIFIYIYIYNCKLINPCNAYNINQDSGAWVLIFEGFWVLTWVFEWCRIHIKTVFAQHPQPFPPRFSQEIPETPQNRRKPPISWENLGEPGRTWRTWEDLGGNSWDWGFLRRAWESCKS
jgi:hypothetical protein